MKRFTKEQASIIQDSRIWKDWSDEDIVKFQLFQLEPCIDYVFFMGACYEVFQESSIFVFNIANKWRKIYLETKQEPTFEELVNMLPPDLIKKLNI